jgi:hypothetical protein
MSAPRAPGRIPCLERDFAPGERPHEYRSRDGRRLLEVKLRPQGIRDLHATLLGMAQAVSGDRGLSRGILAAWMPRASDERIAREWNAALALFRPALAERLALVVVRPDRVLPLPEDRDLRRWGECLRGTLGRLEPPARESRPAPSRSFFEIFKVLLAQRLLRKGPLPIGELMRRTGSSYPTVADALRRLEAAGELARRSNRSVELPQFPERTWPELLALSDGLRRSRSFADLSGRRRDPHDLFRRLQALPSLPVAIGGVQAARHWDPDFDLHGLPRLDLLLHAAGGEADLSFVARLDPALKEVPGRSTGIVLSVHPLVRAEPLFEPHRKGGLPWADPVETLLDLHELRLTEQAEAMARRLSETPAP